MMDRIAQAQKIEAFEEHNLNTVTSPNVNNDGAKTAMRLKAVSRHRIRRDSNSTEHGQPC
jgi:hypothetical protein